MKSVKKRTKEESKASHRLIERRRTKRINELIQKLKEEVMSNGFKVKKDKASILESAIDCIEHLKKSLKEVSGRLELATLRERAFLMAKFGYETTLTTTMPSTSDTPGWERGPGPVTTVIW